ncbi:MAG: PKD domain-containing protein, partial [Thermoplasmatota archaeon]
MKIEKIIVVLIAISCLFITQSTQVKALEASGIIEDPVGDVYDLFTDDIVTQHDHVDVDNIDIIKIEYDIVDEKMELSLWVHGVIENRGSIDEFDEFEHMESESFDIDSILYMFTVELSEDALMISYCNNTARVESIGMTTNLSESDFTISQDQLRIVFDYDSTNQELIEIRAVSQYIRLKIDDILEIGDLDDDELESIISFLIDEVPNGPLQVFGSSATLKEVGQEIEFEGNIWGGYPPYFYIWDFGDGTTSTEKNTVHSYDTPGVYEVSFTVTDGV